MKTPSIELEEISEADTPAAPEINESFWVLDAIVQLNVLDKDRTVPPSSAEQGDKYIVDIGAGGEWVGHDRHVAYMTPEGWRFRTPRHGWVALVADEGAHYWFNQTQWLPLIGAANAASLPVFIGAQAASSAYTLNFLEGGGHELTLLGNTTLSVQGATEGRVVRTIFIVRQDAVGGRSINFPAGTVWPGGAAPLTSTDPYAVNVYELVTYDGGVTLYARLLAGSVYNASGVPQTYPTTEDAFWPYVSYLLHMDGANGSSTFTDERGHTITANGSDPAPTLTTSIKKFGTASASFTMAAPTDFFVPDHLNYLSVAQAAENDFTSQDFTIEAWVRLKSTSNQSVLFAKGDDSAPYYFVLTTSGTALQFDLYRADFLLMTRVVTWNNSSNQLSTSAFKHVALERKDGVFFLSIEGQQWTDGVAYTEVDLSVGPFLIGGGDIPSVSNAYAFAAMYLDEVRVTLGRARYAQPVPEDLDPLHFFAEFAPPVLPFAAPATYTPEVFLRKRVLGAYFFRAGGGEISLPLAPIYVRVPNRCRIRKWTVLGGGGPGSCEFDIWLAPFVNYPPDVYDSIVAAAPPLLTSGHASEDSTLAGWTTDLEKGDVLGFSLVDVDEFSEVTVQLEVEEMQ